MLKRQDISKDNKVKVTFVLPDRAEQPTISVVGDFNEWNPTATRLVKRNNGTRSASVKLDTDGRYAFRYYTADGEWFNDHSADAYEVSTFGAENCILLT